jgi:lipoate-protein ligase A
VQEGRIAGIRFFGDYMGRDDVGVLETLLVGVRYDRDSVSAALDGVDVSAFFGDISRADVIGVVCP